MIRICDASTRCRVKQDSSEKSRRWAAAGARNKAKGFRARENVLRATLRSHGLLQLLLVKALLGGLGSGRPSKTRAPLSGRSDWNNSLADGYFNQAAAAGPCGFFFDRRGGGGGEEGEGGEGGGEGGEGGGGENKTQKPNTTKRPSWTRVLLLAHACECHTLDLE